MKVKVEPPEGYHWMVTEQGPMLMPGDYVPHDNAVEFYEFDVMEQHETEEVEKPGPGKRSKEWDAIFEAILEQTGDSDLAAATATARVGKKEEEPVKKVLFVVSTPTDLDAARGQHLCGSNGAKFAKHYLEPLGLRRSDVDVADLGELADIDKSSASMVVALGKAAKQILGPSADFNLPHPAAIQNPNNFASLQKRLSEFSSRLEKLEDSFLPPKGVQEAAARGLELRREHNRGGTAIGVARARDLSNGRRVSLDTIKRMYSYLSRHEVDLERPKNRDRSDPQYPGAGLIAWLLWGGNPAKSWSQKIYNRWEREQETKKIMVAKREEAKRVVYGIVLDPYIVDAHDDNLSPAVIEETAHDWMRNSRIIGLDHNGKAEGAEVVESWIHHYPSEEDYKAAIAGQPHKAYETKFGDDVLRSGSWVIGVKLTPEQWARVQAGDINAFSIGGQGKREEVDPAELPDVEFVQQS